MGKKKEKCQNTGKHIRIAFLGHKTIPSRMGGVELVVEELAVRMAQKGHQVTVYNRDMHHVGGKEFDSKKVKKYKNISMKYVPTIEGKGLAAISASFFAAFSAALGKYDVVHFHAEGPCIMLWLPKLMGKRCIATVHGLDHQRAKWGRLARACILAGEKCAVKYADEIVVLSQSVQKYFLDTYGREVKFIPNGVTRPQIRECEVIKQKYHLEKDGYILFLSRLVPEKGVHYLIHAFCEISTDKKLVIAGGSSDTKRYVEQLEKIAKGEERIIFTGFVQGKELDELYSNAYLYVLPSDLEGMPLSLLEAMSYGNCCLVSNIPECVEVVQDKAMVFKKGNINHLREMLQYACEHEEVVAGYKKQAADYICNKYKWDDVADATELLYRGKV